MLLVLLTLSFFYSLVTEVVWEGEETDAKDTKAGKNCTDSRNSSNDHDVKVEDSEATHAANRY